MAKKTIKAQMKQRRDTKANWAATNPVLLDGELGIVSDDPNLYKVGDGATAWNSLPFRGFDGTLAQELGTSPNAVISQKVVSDKINELNFDDSVLEFEPGNNTLSKQQLKAPKVQKGRKLRLTMLNPHWDISGVTSPYNGFGVGYIPKGKTEAEYTGLYTILVPNLTSNNQTQFDIDITDDWELLNIELRASEKVYIRVEDITNLHNFDIYAVSAKHDGANKSSTASAPFIPYMGFENKYWGKSIVGIRIKVAQPGSFSVVKVTGDPAIHAAVDDSKIEILKVFDVKQGGISTLYFDNPVVLSKGEYLGFQVPTDTAVIYYEGTRYKNLYGVNFIYRYAATNSWESGDGQDLQVDILVKETEDFFLSGKKISILGDSISTFSGMIPSGNAKFYPTGDVQTRAVCWWNRLLSLCRAKLEINQSWSGSRITTTGSQGVAFIDDSRIKALGSPDVIFVFGGTNDFGQSGPAQLGDFVKVNNGDKDKTKFRPAYQYLVETLQATYPLAEIVLLVPLQRTSFGLFGNNAQGWNYQDLKESIITIADMYGVKYVDLSKCGINQGNLSAFTIDGLHPNVKGMEKITSYIIAQLN